MGKNSAAREARRARQEEDARESMIKKGSAAIRAQFANQFDEKYYDDAFENQKKVYATDFNQQWESARKQLEAALMRAGIYDSSAGIQRMDEAEDTRARRETEYQSLARQQVEGRRQNVLAAEDTVLAQLRSSGDQASANASAAQQLNAQSKPIAFSPLGAVFTDLTAGLATQAEQERQGTNRYNLGISTWGSPKRYTSNVGG
jgi:hypothetical protein